MTHPTIQVDYDQLADIARRFEAWTGASRQMHQRLQRGVTGLQNGGWAGVAAEAFYGEMDAEIFPALARLEAALEQAAAVTRQISDVMHQAEEEAAAPFRGAAEGVAAGGDGPAGDGASAGGGAGPMPREDVMKQRAANIFSKGYMEQFIGSSFPGDTSRELNRLMEDLVRAQTATGPKIDSILDQIATIRGVDQAKFRAQHQTYLQLMESGYANGGAYPDINMDWHPDFLGSRVSLRYGAVVGEVFGLDPVFGALLNPTGGLVGPGSYSYHPADENAVGYHGVFHDAAGYLYNFHKIGPGYGYLNQTDLLTSWPTTGHLNGVSFWMSRLDMDKDIPAKSIPDLSAPPRFTALTDGNDAIVNSIGDVFAGAISEGVNDIGAGLDTIMTGLGRSVLDIFD